MSASQSAPSGLQNIKNQLGYLIVDMDENILEVRKSLILDCKIYIFGYRLTIDTYSQLVF